MFDSESPWALGHQAPLSKGFSKQEYWSGLPFSSPADLLYTGIEPVSPAFQADSLLSEPSGAGAKSMPVVTAYHLLIENSNEQGF